MNKPLKIKTITCHNVYNHGASLQEYALLTYLNSLGHQAETISYNPDYLSNHFNFLAVSNPKWEKNIILKSIYLILKLPERLISLKRKYNFDKFSKNYIKSTKQNYTSNNDLINKVPNAEVFICGSDQIWNSFFQNGKDPAFYLDFVPKDKLKISYAASFATKTIEDSLKQFVKEKVNKIDFISVRETTGIDILKDININNVTQVLDPVFLLDKNLWFKLTKPISIKKPYLLVYDADKNTAIKKMSIKMAKENNWVIITISPQVKYAKKNLSNKGPDVFLSLIKNAEFIISNSFHAVAFSIIFNKQFVVFNRGEKINTRMQDFVTLLKIPNTILTYDYNYNEKDTFHIDYNLIKPILEENIINSKKFIENSLKQINK